MSAISCNGRRRLSEGDREIPCTDAGLARRRLCRIAPLTPLICLLFLGSVAQAQRPVDDFERSLRDPRSGRILQVQSSVPERPLDPRIEAMPQTDQSLQVIHHRSQLVITRQRVRRIATSDPSIIEVVQFSETEFAILGTGLGISDLWLWFEGEEEPLMYEVTVIRDPSLDEQRRLDYGRIERKLALLYPNSKVYLIPLSRKIIVRGQARDAEEAARILQIVRGEVIAQEGDLYGYGAQTPGTAATGGGPGVDDLSNGTNGYFSSLIVDELTVPGEFQVMVRVRIAELNRSQLRRMGIDWQAIIQNSLVPIGTLGTFAASPTFSLTGIFNNNSLQVAIDMLASNGSARILEDAQLVVLSGEPAAFLSGGEFAVPTIIGIAGAQGQSTSFRGFGTSIIATPTVIDHDLVRMQIIPELSSINEGNSVNGIPGTNVKRVQTRVELREGQSIMLGGLFSRREQAEVSRIPFLGEIPVVGSIFFHGKRATEDETELLIIVTPEIVRPMDADQVPPLPGWYVTHPDDHDFYKYNRIEGNPDLGNYELLPYGNGQGFGQDVGYNFFNPPPVDGQLSPAINGGPYGVGMGGAGTYQLPGGSYPSADSVPQYQLQQNPYQPQPDRYMPAPGQQRMYGPSRVNPVPPALSPVPEPTPAGPQTNYRGHSIAPARSVQQTSALRIDPRVQRPPVRYGSREQTQ